ncbi:MAG: GIY-YIG nuclease family protein [Bacteroidales bacterium]|nr:GIY-YIG nuclease family protein [Bacteroidales bacterium]
MPQLYSIIDIETTGGRASQDKITEIAIIVTDGKKIVNSFSSLINPECRIPAFIVNLTGITNELVENSPYFYEIAKDIVEITKDTVFVAHNVNFDYSFLKSEFKRLGYNFKLDQLCTVKLSRKIIPGYKSYSLGNICSELGIEIENRHRAYGDALATFQLFKILYEIDSQNNGGKAFHGFSLKGLHQNLNMQSIKNLPEETGVYYFYDDKNELIYIGKSKNIYKRVLSHLNNEKSSKTMNMRQEIANIDFELTGNELIALLKESHEIKTQKPKYNKAQRRAINQWGIFQGIKENGYISFELDKTANRDDLPLNTFGSQNATKENLFNLSKEFDLCQKLTGLYQSAGACFYFGLGECKGACIGEEPVEQYNKRANKIIEKHTGFANQTLIICKGRHEDEIGVVQIKNGKYIGYGFCDTSFANNIEHIDSCIKHFPENRDVKNIIASFIKQNKECKILKY